MIRLFPLSLLLLVACGGSAASGAIADMPEADLTDPDVATKLVSAASPPAILWTSQRAMQAPSDAVSCPTVEESEDGLEIDVTGGCTDEAGLSFTGTAKYRFEPQDTTAQDLEPVVVEVEDFGYTEQVTCGTSTFDAGTTVTGSLSIKKNGRFSVDLVSVGVGHHDGCVEHTQTTAFVYSGSFENVAGGERWSGSGEIGSSDYGRAKVSTDNQLDDDTCSWEAESGSTTVTAGGHKAVISYDGAEDCSEQSTVTWTLDGEDQGELTGVACSSSGGSVAWIWLASLGVLGLRRRR